MQEDIQVKKIRMNLKHKRQIIEIEVPGDEILRQVDPASLEFEKMVKRKVIEYIRSL